MSFHVADVYRLVIIHHDEPFRLFRHLQPALILEGLHQHLHKTVTAQLLVGQEIQCIQHSTDRREAKVFRAHAPPQGVCENLMYGPDSVPDTLAAACRTPPNALLLLAAVAVPRRNPPRCDLPAGNDDNEGTRTTVVGKFGSANWPNVAPCRGSSSGHLHVEGTIRKSDSECDCNVQKRSSKGVTTTAHETWRARCEDDCIMRHKRKHEPREKNSRVRKW